jgi:hypothetical protein
MCLDCRDSLCYGRIKGVKGVKDVKDVQDVKDVTNELSRVTISEAE